MAQAKWISRVTQIGSNLLEFIIAAMNQEKLLSVQKMEQAFKIIDLDGDNYISKQELENVMGDIEDDIWN